MAVLTDRAGNMLPCIPCYLVSRSLIAWPERRQMRRRVTEYIRTDGRKGRRADGQTSGHQQSRK